MNNFIVMLKKFFPDFFTEWDINEFPYLFIGDFVCYIEGKGDSIDMNNVNYILNYFLTLQLAGQHKENIIIVGFLEVLHDDELLYQNLKTCATNELKQLIELYM